MDRTRLWYGYLVTAMLLAVAIAPLAGCVGAMTTAAWLVHGNESEPDCKALKGKHVAVLCRPLANLQYENSMVAKELAREVNVLLGQRVSKIKIIDQQKVEQWVDENTDQEPLKLGRALKAEMLVLIDLEHFGVHEGQTIYRGKANYAIKVYDCQEGKAVFTKRMPEVSFPTNGGIPASEKPENEFRQAFVQVLARQIGNRFYSHDRYEDMGFGPDSIQ